MLSSVEPKELRLIEGDQRSVSMGIIGGWLEVFWVKVAQEYHSRLIIALNDERRLVLTACSYGKLALPGKPADRHAVIGRRTGPILVELEVRLVDFETNIQPSKGFHHLKWDDGIALAVEQPDPAVCEIGRIVDQTLVCRLSDDPEGILSPWWGGTKAVVAVAIVVGAGHHCRRDPVQRDGPEGQPGVRNGLDAAVWPSRDDTCAFDEAGEGDVKLVGEERTRGQT